MVQVQNLGGCGVFVCFQTLTRSYAERLGRGEQSAKEAWLVSAGVLCDWGLVPRAAVCVTRLS